MSERVYINKETRQYMEDHIYAKRDVLFIKTKLDEICDAIDAKLASLNITEMEEKAKYWCDDLSDKTNPRKTSFGIVAKDFQREDGKTITSLSVGFYPANFEGLRVTFLPKVYEQKLTMRGGVIYHGSEILPDPLTNESKIKGEDGTERMPSLTEFIARLNGYDGMEDQVALFTNLLPLEEIKDLAVPHGRAAGNRNPIFLSKTTSEVMDDISDGSGRFSEEMERATENGVNKAEPLAKAMAEALDKANAWLMVEREKEANGETQKFTTPCSLRIGVELRKKVVRDADGNIQYRADKDGSKKAVLQPVLDDNGKKIFDTFIDVPGIGIRYDLDVSGPEAVVKGVIQEIWAGNACERRVGFKEVTSKGTDEVKKFIAAIDTVTARERQDSPFYAFYLAIKDEVAAIADTELDDNGEVALDKNGKPRKMEYVSWKREYKNEETGVVYPGHPQINLHNGDHSAIIEIKQDYDYPDILRATFCDFNVEGKAPNRTSLNNEATTKAVLKQCGCEYLYDILAKNVPTCAAPKRLARDAGEPIME